MKRFSFVIFAVYSMTLFMGNAHATRMMPLPSEHALNMKVLDADHRFEHLTDVRIVLTGAADESTNYTGMLVYFDNRMVALAIEPVETTDRQVYNAYLPTSTGPMGERFSVELEYYNGFWLAQVRKGFGWCGTMDDTMKLASYGY